MSLVLRGCFCSYGTVASLSVVSSDSVFCHIPCDSFYNAAVLLDSHNSSFVIARHQSSEDRAIAEDEAVSRAGSAKALDPGGLDQPRNHLTKMNICVVEVKRALCIPLGVNYIGQNPRLQMSLSCLIIRVAKYMVSEICAVSLIYLMSLSPSELLCKMVSTLLFEKSVKVCRENV